MRLVTRDKTKKLRKKHQRLVEEAIYWQRNGKMPLFAEKTAEAEEIAKQIQEIEAQTS